MQGRRNGPEKDLIRKSKKKPPAGKVKEFEKREGYGNDVFLREKERSLKGEIWFGRRGGGRGNNISRKTIRGEETRRIEKGERTELGKGKREGNKEEEKRPHSECRAKGLFLRAGWGLAKKRSGSKKKKTGGGDRLPATKGEEKRKKMNKAFPRNKIYYSKKGFPRRKRKGDVKSAKDEKKKERKGRITVLPTVKSGKVWRKEEHMKTRGGRSTSSGKGRDARGFLLLRVSKKEGGMPFALCGGETSLKNETKESVFWGERADVDNCLLGEP